MGLFINPYVLGRKSFCNDDFYTNICVNVYVCRPLCCLNALGCYNFFFSKDIFSSLTPSILNIKGNEVQNVRLLYTISNKC